MQFGRGHTEYLFSNMQRCPETLKYAFRISKLNYAKDIQTFWNQWCQGNWGFNYTKISRITEVDSAAKFRMSEFHYVQRARQSEFNYVKDIHNVSMQQYWGHQSSKFKYVKTSTQSEFNYATLSRNSELECVKTSRISDFNYTEDVKNIWMKWCRT